MTRRINLASWGGDSLALVGHRSSYGVTMKIPHELDVVLYQPVMHPSFCNGLGKPEYEPEDECW